MTSGRSKQLAGQNVIPHAYYWQNGRNHQEFTASSRTQSFTAKRSGLEDLEMNNHGNCTAPGQPGLLIKLTLKGIVFSSLTVLHAVLSINAVLVHANLQG